MLRYVRSKRCPDRRFTPAIEAINEKLQAYTRLNTRVDFVECGAPFMEDDDKVRCPNSLR